jgi:hypothetical protein
MMRTSCRLALAAWFVLTASVALPVSGATTHAQGRLASTSVPFIRGVYGKDTSSSGYGVIAANGFNSVMTGPYRQQLDPLAAEGLKGIVWLGNFRNAPICGFDRDDASVTSLVTAIAGHPAILAYYLGDEPHVSECPNAPSLFRQRSNLVHSLDARSTTFTVIQASENGISHDYAPWAGSVDIIGFDVYPCARATAACNFGAIDAAIQAIRSAGITRFWAIVQDFQDCYYRLPTPQELGAQFDHWAKSAMSGYFVFSWNYQPADPRCIGVSLSGHPDNIAELKYENSRSFVSSTGSAANAPLRSHGAPPISAVLAILIFGALALAAGAVAVGARIRSR